MRNLFSIIFMIAILPQYLKAQNEPTIDTLLREPITLEEVIVYANKFAESAAHVSQTVKVIKDKFALNLQPNTADLLINSGNLFVQKSQGGGGSPVIRGFEASRVLLMVDGVRINNAIFRAGHLQNIITVDNMVLDRVEILYGPSSTLYGSDALGGVINLYTRNPLLSLSNQSSVTGNATMRYATATEEARGNVIFNIGGKQWASLTSITYGSFGDIKAGEQMNDKYPGFGLKPFIVKRFGNIDSAVANPDSYKQAPAGYKQIDVTQKFLYQPKENIQHILNLQFSNTNDIPRYDRLTETSNGNPVYAEWYFGPQSRNMASYNFSANKLGGFFNEIKVVASYQDIAESRISRKFRSSSKDFRWEHVNVFGINADMKHYSKKNELHIGVESYSNFVRSTAERMDILSNTPSRIHTRYSDGPTSMSYQALYAQHTFKINDRWTLNDGLRLNLVQLNAVFADTTLMHFPFTKAKQSNIAVTGDLGLIYATPKNLRVAFLLSTGFRAPNVDDLSKVFDSEIGTVIVPNTTLKPEYTYNAEINFNQYAGKFNFGGSVFYTLFRNALVVDRFQLNGQDSIIYNDVKSVVLANQNKAKAYIYGFSANVVFTFAKNTSIEGVFTYTYGRFNESSTSYPLDHIPPVYGRVSVKHSETKWLAECYTLFNGWKKIADYNPNGEDNEQYATADGMPSWYTLNLRGAVNIGKNLLAQLQMENLLDRNYRYFASGISAPGRNIVASLKLLF